MENKQREGRAVGALLSAVIVLVFAHVPLWLLRPYAAIPQPLFELDLLLGAVVFSLNRRVGGVAIIVAWCLCLLRAVAVNYHFHNVAEFVDTIRFADLLSYSAFVTPTTVLISGWAVLIMTVILRGLALLQPKPKIILALTALLVVADILNGSATTVTMARDAPFTAFNVLGSAGYNLVRAERDFLHEGAQPLAALEPLPLSYRVMRAAADEGRDGNLMVLVESLGLPQAPGIRAWTSARFLTPNLRARWSIEESAEDFAGGTVAGELRVLCGLRGHYSRLTVASSWGCLPRRFRGHGENAVAMHGFSSRMFDRGEWWPIAGFGETRFASNWVEPETALCPGAFNGICDHGLIAAALRRAARPSQFVYALTINTHLPLPSHPVSRELKELCRHHAVPDPACELLQAQGDLLADLAGQMAQSPEVVRQVVVVGDHSPPFSDASNRAVFSPSQVPIWVLSRR